MYNSDTFETILKDVAEFGESRKPKPFHTIYLLLFHF